LGILIGAEIMTGQYRSAIRRDVGVYIRLSEDEKSQMKTFARGAGLSLSSWLRMQALAALRGATGAQPTVDPWGATIGAWLEKPIPADWYKRPGSYVQMTEKMVERTKVCVQEILSECLALPPEQQTTQNRRRVGRILRGLPAWSAPREPVFTFYFGKRYGQQRGWQKLSADVGRRPTPAAGAPVDIQLSSVPSSDSPDTEDAPWGPDDIWR